MVIASHLFGLRVYQDSALHVIARVRCRLETRDLKDQSGPL
jgi:hypothetical protein